MITKYIHREDIHNLRSSDVIAPLIVQLLNPVSIIDIGCGIGTWLKSFKDLGVTDVIGLDGAYVDQKLLRKYLLSTEFVSKDLRVEIDLKRKFDLAICLEVVEHLPLESVDIIIKSLANHSDTILFSAAIPGQGGQNHINEQWPDYWISKFASHGYQVYDPFRQLFWENENVDPWYRQNILLFSKIDLKLAKPSFTKLVHPFFFERKSQYVRAIEKQAMAINEGKVGVSFYLKRLFVSLFRYGGRKV
ncbi:class I SAM-dependent methyltransferase [Algoriphagus chordae]|uniref:Methyltransferase family protein n=1 Tax=Algoriphagus chordae TaxID=237019 RepID=A0A2W7SAS1_9BACT|nr:class I SAM-dependent methyltransferase [Algoriphagus chordae]PZX47642.1 methyltransferase family protein [Algoriphagus chordae]